ncbi:MAG: virulence RhuM family protein [Muribaculaceae bacterium]|nr:virulence RhuM family protein [Muribaculaceae bacterium]
MKENFPTPPAESLQDNEIILYQPDSTTSLDVRVAEDTVWLTQAQIVELFASSKANISEHLKNIFNSKELERESTVRKFRTIRTEGGRPVNRNLEYFNLDVIISVGYRVNTKRGIQFRRWANKVLKSHLLRGYSVNQRLLLVESRIDHRFAEYDQRLDELSDKVDFFVRASLPPREGIFFDGQIFDAYTLVCDLVRSAKRRIIVVDNYIDDTVFRQLDKRTAGVEATIFTSCINRTLRQDLERHNSQYPPIEIKNYRKAHDRFLIIDDSVYHVGASLKDLGKKLFAFSKMEFIAADELIERISGK